VAQEGKDRLAEGAGGEEEPQELVGQKLQALRSALSRP